MQRTAAVCMRRVTAAQGFEDELAQYISSNTFSLLYQVNLPLHVGHGDTHASAINSTLFLSRAKEPSLEASPRKTLLALNGGKKRKSLGSLS